MQGQENLIDFMWDNLQKPNKMRYLQIIRETITNQTAIEQPNAQIKSEQQVASILQSYEDEYRKFMYTDTLLTHSKSNGLIDQCLNCVHPGLKIKKDSKHILSIITKIFTQELIEESIQVVEEYKAYNKLPNTEDMQNNSNENSITNSKKKQKRSQEVDIDVIQQAYRRILLKKQKL